MIVSDPSQQLCPFLAKQDAPDLDTDASQEAMQPEVVYMRFCGRSEFEWALTLKNSYYITFKSNRFELDCN